MKTIEELYTFIDKCNTNGEVSPSQMELYKKVEEQLFVEDVAVRVAKAVESELAGIRRSLTLIVDYNPDGKVRVRPTIDGTIIESSATILQSTQIDHEPTGLPKDGEEDSLIEGQEELPQQDAEPVSHKKAPSIGFTVYINENKLRSGDAKDTFILALKYIGLRRILNDVELHNVKHKIESLKVGVVWHTEHLYTKGKNIGKSPQEEVDNLYVYKGLSNETKVDDLITLGKFYKDIDLRVEWDDGKVVYAIKDELPNEESDTGLVAEPTPETIPLSIRGRFRQFMKNSIIDSTANGYIRVLDNEVRDFINENIDNDADSIFSFTNPKEVSICIEMLNELPAFIEENDRLHHKMSAALGKYQDFIQSENK